MSIENRDYSVNDLEHVKFTPESTPDDSTIQVSTVKGSTTNEEISQIDRVVCALDQVIVELQKMNAYWSLITNTTLSEGDQPNG